MNLDVVLVDIIANVVSKMVVPNYQMNFQVGRNIQILDSLTNLDTSITMKGNKYPLIALVLPVREKRGLGYYSNVKIGRIVIATITNSTNDVFTRYQAGETFKECLYPCYYEFLKRLGQSPNVVCGDPNAFIHDKMDNPGLQPIGEGLSDYIDSIEILNLELTLNQIKTC